MRNYNKERSLRIWELAALLALSISLCAGAWAEARQSSISSRLIRLHVIAASDETQEQEIKLRVRDAVLEYLAPRLGGVGKGLLVTQVDRKSRFLRAGLLAKRDASLTKAVICQLLKDVPVKSISLDNGSEFSEFKALEAELHTLVYFAEPHKPWQRGTNENTNGLLRFFFPKGCDFHTVS